MQGIGQNLQTSSSGACRPTGFWHALQTCESHESFDCYTHSFVQ